MKTRKLKRIRVAEVSGVDEAANPHAKVMLMKRATGEKWTLPADHALLPAILAQAERWGIDVEGETNMTDHTAIAKRLIEVQKAGPAAVLRLANSRDPADQELWLAYKSATPVPATPSGPVPVAKSDAYLRLEKAAKKLARRTGLTEAAAFAKIYVDPANAELVALEKASHFAKSADPLPPARAPAPSTAFGMLAAEREQHIRKAAAPPFVPQADPVPEKPPKGGKDSPNLRALREIARSIQAQYPNRRYTDEEALIIAARTPKGQNLLRARRDGDLARLLGHAA